MFTADSLCCCKPTSTFTTAMISSLEAADFMLEKVFVFITLSPFKSVPWSNFTFIEEAFGVEITAILLPP